MSFRSKHRDSKLRLGELLPVSVAFKTSHTALEADCPGNSGTKQEVPFTKLILESHSLALADKMGLSVQYLTTLLTSLTESLSFLQPVLCSMKMSTTLTLMRSP